MANEIYLNSDDSVAQTVVDFGTVFEEKVISGGGITFATSAIEIDTEDDDAADDLDTIANGGTLKSILMRCASADRVVTVKHATGNILTLDGATDIVLDDPNKLLWLVYNGSFWIAMALGGGGAPEDVSFCVYYDFLTSNYSLTSTPLGGDDWGSGSGFLTWAGDPNFVQIVIPTFVSTLIRNVVIYMDEYGAGTVSRTITLSGGYTDTGALSGPGSHTFNVNTARTGMTISLTNNTNDGIIGIVGVMITGDLPNGLADLTHPPGECA